MIARAGQPDDTVEIEGEPCRIDALRSAWSSSLVSSLEDAAQRNAELEASRAAPLARRPAAGSAPRHRGPRAALSLASLLLRAENSVHAQNPAERPLRARAGRGAAGRSRCIGIIDDLQDIARIEAGTMRIEPRPADLAEVVARPHRAHPAHRRLSTRSSRTCPRPSPAASIRAASSRWSPTS